jgi:hypothetical protein
MGLRRCLAAFLLKSAAIYHESRPDRESIPSEREETELIATYRARRGKQGDQRQKRRNSTQTTGLATKRTKREH